MLLAAGEPLAPFPVIASPVPSLAVHPPCLHLLTSLLPRFLAIPSSPAIGMGINLGAGVGAGLGMAFGVGKNRARGRGRDIGHRLRALVMYTAAHGPLPDDVHPPNHREAAVLAFVTAASSFPSTISVSKRRALEVALTPHQIQQVAMAASFAAFYSTIVSLLGLDDRSLASPALERLRASLNFQVHAIDLKQSDRDDIPSSRRCPSPYNYREINDNDFQHDLQLRAGPSSLASSSARTIPDEHGMSSPNESISSHPGTHSLFSRLRFSSGSNSPHGRGRDSAPPAPGFSHQSAASPATGRKGMSRFSYKRRIFNHSAQHPTTSASPIASATSKSARVSQAFKHAAAVRALQSTEQYWLSAIPSDEEHQDRFLTGLCGFVPEYVRQVTSAEDRRGLVFALSFLCDADGEGQIPAATRLIMSYVLSKAAENPALSAHAGFLAIRFGTTLTHLQIACDYPLLLDMRDVYDRLRTRSHRVHRGPGSTITSSSSGGPAPAGSFGDAYDGDILENMDSEPFPYVDDDSSEDSDDEPIHVVETGNGHDYSYFDNTTSCPQAMPESAYRPPSRKDLRTARDGRSASGSHGHVFRSASSLAARDLDGDDSSGEEADGSYSSESSDSSADMSAAEFYDSEQSLRCNGVCDSQDDEDEPQVPCIDTDPKSSRSNLQPEQPYAAEGDTGHIPFPQPDESLLKVGMWMFTERDVSLLILAHQSARSARRSSSVGSDDVGRMQLSPKDVESLTETLSPPAIVEAVTIIAVQALLQRWTAAYPYRAGALENAVRRFVQGPVGHELDVRSVGQRCASRMDSDFSALSGCQQGRRRPLHLPRRMMSSL